MQIRLLGPVEVDVDGRPLQLGGPKQRSVLSLLALNANSTMSVGRLIEGLWGEEQPASASKMVQLYVSQLRKLLVAEGGVEIITHGRDYELRLDREVVDALRFERLVAEASGSREDAGAGEAATGALALWRGPPLADLLDEPFAPAEARRLEELHLAAIELSIESELGAGRHLELIGRLEALVTEHPMSERLHALRMLALYRAGRQAAALDAYRSARKVLVDEIGVEPGPELRRMHEAILRQDQALELIVPDAAWTRRETAERVGDEAGQAAARRGELRRLEAGLASDVADLTELHDRRAALVGAPPGGDSMPICPFKGLAAFEASDADYFFGRERLVAEIVARLVGARVLAVVGPSGSGKSSVVRAGLLPALAGGVLPGSERWRQVVMRPGEHPLAELNSRLGAVVSDRRVVLAVDQFEETFTACRDEVERAAFVDALLDAAQRDDRPVTVVLALRADYYGACAAHPRLAAALGESHVLVGPMAPDELTKAISAPAGAAGLVIEPELVDRLVDDVTGQGGALPLLSTALLELWQRRDGRAMRLAAYERTGGVDGAVARLAEQAYGSLTEDDQRVARRILMRLAGSGEGDTAVRRRVSLDELELGDDAQATRVLGVLADSRLVTIGEGTAEVAHEALLREWPRLSAWLEEDAEGRRLHRRITLSARDWEAGGRDPGELVRGARLASALDWALDHGDVLNGLEREFLEQSRLAGEQAAERGRRANRRLRALLAGAVGALVIALAAGLLALSQRGDARHAALVADAQRLSAQALTDDRLDHALLLARTGVALDETPATLGSLLSVLQRSPAVLGEFRGEGWPAWAVSVSPDGRRLALGDEDGNVTVYDLASRRRMGRYQQSNGGLVQGLRFSPDSRTLAVAGYKPGSEARPVVDLIDPASGRRRLRITPPSAPGLPDLVFLSLAFAPNGRDLLVLQYARLTGDPASILRRFDGRTGAQQRPPLRVGRHGALFLSPTGDRRFVFATSEGDGRSYEIDADRLRVTRQWPVGGFVGAVSADGRTYALGAGGAVRLLDLRSGRVRTLPQGHHADVRSLAFTPDGATLASGDDSGAVIVSDVAAGRVRERLSGHTDSVTGMEVSADGRTLYTASKDARVIAWDLAGDRRLDRPFDPGPPFEIDNQSPRGFAISPDGRRLAVTQADGTVNLLDTRTLAPRGRFHALDGYAAAVEFSPDGRLLAVTGGGGRVTLWDARTLRAAGELRGLPPEHAQALAFSPDGRLLAGATAESEDTSITQVWDVRSRTPTRARFHALASSLAFSPNGRLLAAAGVTGPTQVRDARSGRLVAALRTAADGRSVAFSPDGTLLATGLYNGAIELWSTQDWGRAEPPLEGHSGRITALEFAPNGRTLLSGGTDGTLQLWDVASRKPLGSPQPVQPNHYIAAVFAPDGQRVFAVSDGRFGVRWTVSPEVWKQHACAVAGREQSAREWSDALPGRPYRAVCDGG